MWNKWHGANDCCHRSRNPVYSMLQHLINPVIAECDLNTKSRNTPRRRDCNLVENQPSLEHISPGRIDPIHWIPADIEILMQGFWIDGLTILWVSAEESSGCRVVVSGAQIVEAQVRVELFAAIHVVVGRCARSVDLIAKGIVLIRVRHGSCSIGEEPSRRGIVVSGAQIVEAQV